MTMAFVRQVLFSIVCFISLSSVDGRPLPFVLLFGEYVRFYALRFAVLAFFFFFFSLSFFLFCCAFCCCLFLYFAGIDADMDRFDSVWF